MTWRNDVTGSEAWWQEQQTQGIPRIDPQQDGTCLVTFFWRDPQGSEKRQRLSVYGSTSLA
jgi:hypothetical protein